MINSFGGEIYEAFAIVDIIRNSVTPIDTYGLGSVMSASLPVFLAGRKRYAYKLCSFMYHETTTDYEGKARGQVENAEECKRIMAMFDKQIVSSCKIKQSELDKVKLAKKDWYFTAQEAKKLGMVHEVI
jgi:ATP-dependent Clp protease protease subunit